MKNNILSAFVIFFAVVACLLIIDDITHKVKSNDIDSVELNANVETSNSSNLATLDLETEE